MGGPLGGPLSEGWYLGLKEVEDALFEPPAVCDVRRPETAPDAPHSWQRPGQLEPMGPTAPTGPREQRGTQDQRESASEEDRDEFERDL